MENEYVRTQAIGNTRNRNGFLAGRSPHRREGSREIGPARAEYHLFGAPVLRRKERADLQRRSIDFVFQSYPLIDSDQGREIMDLFRKLHSEGTTIVQVTHSDELAGYGERIVTMKDGLDRVIAIHLLPEPGIL
jgi:ABC-type lipoprotein export system ATPase subunit